MAKMRKRRKQTNKVMWQLLSFEFDMFIEEWAKRWLYCPCGDRPASQCDEEWGPKCDLGNNEKHCRVATPQPVVLKQH
jgi:hypothetical protein